MKPEEKLEKLIKLAWENGFPTRGRYVYGEFDDDSGNAFWFRDEMNLITDKVDIEAIVFDHEFIRTLCKAKYEFFESPLCALCGGTIGVGARGEYPEKTWETITLKDERNGIRRNDASCEDCDSDGMLFVYSWQYHIQQLAISTDRIEYLWETFESE